ncbi:MAG: hypothetical protein QN834_07170 [Nitrososphaeraceae archaeon]|nr:hypothetical protein [Nitrososphaeraceae archaeon]
MKYQPGFTDFFMSPVTGRIILPMFPDLYQNYVWIGDRNDRPLPSPIIIDLRLEIIDLRRRLSETRFILQAASQDFDSSQALNELIPGILRHTDGIVSIAIPWVDYVPPILPEKNIWIGNADDEPEPYPRIFLENLPSMLSVDPTLLLGAYNLYRGSPNPLTLGIPEIVKTLHITNMADLEEGYLWLGTNSTDPLNFGTDRPVPIIILPLANMANLPDGKVWVGDSGDRPVPSDILTELQDQIDDINDEITTINENITEINTELGDINLNIDSIFDSLLEINVELGDINIDIESLFDLVSDITVDFGDIIIRLDALDGIVADLQTQIDTNVASGLDHLADLQLQIDTAIASGLDAEAGINLRLDALELAVTTINSTITTILSDISSIFSSLSTIASQITTILSDITVINTTLTSLQTQIDTINTTITSIQSDITTIYSDISTINSSITSILSSISTINSTLTSLQSQINTINSTITTIQGNITTLFSDITNITTVLLPAVYTYIDDAITNITNNFIAGGVIDMNDNRIINLPCDPEEDGDAISFCFLWHVLHDEVNVLWS